MTLGEKLGTFIGTCILVAAIMFSAVVLHATAEFLLGVGTICLILVAMVIICLIKDT